VVRKIGEELKSARLEKGISLTRVQQETRIRSRYLEAIEAGDFSVIPGGDIYLKGFIRSYARAIGLPAQPVIARYENLQAEKLARQIVQQGRSGPNVFIRIGRGLRACVQGTLQWFGL